MSGRDRTITVRGQVFANAKECAEALGVTREAVYFAKRHGRLDVVGLGLGRGGKMPITIRGVSYPSVTDAAAALDLSPSTISHALTEGRLDTVGLSARFTQRRAVTIRGVTYASMRQAAEAIGVHISTVSHAAKLGRLDFVGIARNKGNGQVTGTPVTIRGVTYPSRAEAARALGLTPTTINKAARRGALDRVGVGLGGSHKKQVTIRGVTYPSLAAAARAIGVATSTVRQAAREGRLDGVGLKRSERPCAKAAEKVAGAVPVSPGVSLPALRPVPAPAPVVEFHPGVAARRELRARLAERARQDPGLAWPADWFDGTDSLDAARCRKLWASALLLRLGDCVAKFEAAWGALMRSGEDVLVDQAADLAWRTHMHWIGTHDFKGLCLLAGFEPDAVSDRLRPLRARPQLAQAMLDRMGVVREWGSKRRAAQAEWSDDRRAAHRARAKASAGADKSPQQAGR